MADVCIAEWLAELALGSVANAEEELAIDWRRHCGLQRERAFHLRIRAALRDRIDEERSSTR